MIDVLLAKILALAASLMLGVAAAGALTAVRPPPRPAIVSAPTTAASSTRAVVEFVCPPGAGAAYVIWTTLSADGRSAECHYSDGAVLLGYLAP